MSKVKYYRQCFLEKKLTNSRLQQVAYIPDQFAVVGKVLKVKEADEWDDGWKVMSIGPKREAEAVEHDDSRLYSKIREYTDLTRSERQ